MFTTISNSDLDTITGGTDWQSVRTMGKAGSITGAMGGLFVGGALPGVGSLPGAAIGAIGGAAVGAGAEYYRQNRASAAPVNQ